MRLDLRRASSLGEALAGLERAPHERRRVHLQAEASPHSRYRSNTSGRTYSTTGRLRLRGPQILADGDHVDPGPATSSSKRLDFGLRLPQSHHPCPS